MSDSEYYVVFTDSPRPCLKWARPGFRHCYVARNDFGMVWTLIQDTMSHLDVRTKLVSEYPTVRDLAGKDAHIVPVVYDIEKRHRGHFCLFNCVEVVKAVLGIREPFILTPYQLYRYLL